MANWAQWFPKLKAQGYSMPDIRKLQTRIPGSQANAIIGGRWRRSGYSSAGAKSGFPSPEGVVQPDGP